MAGFQVSIGAMNDIADRDRDAVVQPWKAIPSGRVSLRMARVTAVVGALIGILGSLALGRDTLAIGLLGYGSGLAYDLRLKRTAWGWICFAVALPLVPVYAWLGVEVGLPPQVVTLFVLGGLAGLELAIANGLVDAPGDQQQGARGIAILLGPRIARAVMAATGAAVFLLAWLSLVGVVGTASETASVTVTFGLTLGGVLLAAGVLMSARDDAAWVWRGWQAQACGIAVVALVWLAAIS